MPHEWTVEDITDQTGRVALVTGANSGIGFEAAKALALKGATVVLACRDVAKAEIAVAEIRSAAPDADLEVLPLDLASLSSVAEAAQRFRDDHERLDLLVNNAGVMAIPRSLTEDGFEMQFGVNHLGHFALTGRLIDLVLDTDASRVVTVSSMAHRFGWMNFDDLHGERRYLRWLAYGQSKLANLLFTFELQRRLTEAGTGSLAIAAHPGTSATNLGRLRSGQRFAWFQNAVLPLSDLLAQSAAMGALPTLRAACDPDAAGGDYFGPGGFMEQRGHPVKVGTTRRARDAGDAGRLWEVSVELTGVRYEPLGT